MRLHGAEDTYFLTRWLSNSNSAFEVSNSKDHTPTQINFETLKLLGSLLLQNVRLLLEM